MENKKTITPSFIIINDVLFEPQNIILEEELKECVYIKNFGSHIHPKLYLKLRNNYEWDKESQFIGNYDNLIKFFENNKYNIICMDGFNRVTVARLIKILNILNDTDIKMIKFKNSVRKQQYLNHFVKKQQITLQNYNELSCDLEMICKLEDEYIETMIETRLERPENTEPCGENFIVKEEEIFVNPNDNLYRYYQMCPQCGYLVNIPKEILSEDIKQRIEDRCSKDDKLFRKMFLYSELFSLDKLATKGQKKVLKK